MTAMLLMTGNLGADPEVIPTETGKLMVTFNIASTEHWKDKNTGEKKERTFWAKITVMSEGLAKVATDYLKKGSKVFVQATPVNRKWTGKNGVQRYGDEYIIGQFNGKIELLDRRTNDPAEQHPPSPDLDDDIPF